MLSDFLYFLKFKLPIKLTPKIIYFSFILSAWLMIPACLPVDQVKPDCFPEEGCPLNLSCIEGRCVSPQTKLSHVSLNCLGQQGCYDQLLNAGFERACLFIEQPETLFAVPFNFDQAREDFVELNLALKEAPLRATVMLMETQDIESPCPSSPQAIKQKGFLDSCNDEQGCLLKLRTLTIEREQITKAEPLLISFDGSAGQCIESRWRENLNIMERCNASDFDCDGFVDEGLSCEGEAL